MRPPPGPGGIYGVVQPPTNFEAVSERWAWAAYALAAGLGVACLDLIVGLHKTQAGLSDLHAVAPPLLGSAAFYAIVCFIAVGVQGRPRWREGPSSLSLCLVLPLWLGLVSIAVSLFAGGAKELGLLAGAAVAAAWLALPVHLLVRERVVGLGRGRAVARLLPMAGAVTWCVGMAFVIPGWWWAMVMQGRAPWGTVLGLGVALSVLLLLLLRRFGAPFAKMLFGTATAFYVALAAVALWPQGAGSSHGRSAAQRDLPPVVLVTVDTLRAADVEPPGLIGFERLKRDGIVYANARALAPWTRPSVASLLTGLDPVVHGVVGPMDRLPEAAMTLAERLGEAGYRTGAIGHNPQLGRSFNFAQGFDTFEMFPRPSIERGLAIRILRALFAGSVASASSTTGLTNMAIDWVGERADEPFFLWLHYFDPHVPYEPPPEFLSRPAPDGMSLSFHEPQDIRGGHFNPTQAEREWLLELYHAEVRYVSNELDRLLAELVRLGVYDEALVVLTADHGEEFWEHGGFEHGHTMFDELLRVPLIVKPPGGVAGQSVMAPVSTASVHASILDLIGMPFDASTLSADPLPTRDDAGVGSRPLFATGLLYYEDRFALVDGPHKYVYYTVSGREELYDLAADPRELTSLTGTLPGTTERLRGVLSSAREDSERLRQRLGIAADAPAELDEATRRELVALGYLR